MSYASWSRWVGVAAIVASSTMVGCSSESEKSTEGPVQDEGVGKVAQEITGAPNAVGTTNQTIWGVVKITTPVGKIGSGFVWRSYAAGPGFPAGSYVITARHNLAPDDCRQAFVGDMILQMAGTVARGVACKRFPIVPDVPGVDDPDIAIIKTSLPFIVNKKSVFTHKLLDDDSLLDSTTNRAVKCRGYGGDGIPKKAWFRRQTYNPTFSLVCVAPYASSKYKAALEPGDSGGPCFVAIPKVGTTDKEYQVIGLNTGWTPGAPDGCVAPARGTLVAMDSVVQGWLNSATAGSPAQFVSPP